jgi:hypothetical protein
MSNVAVQFSEPVAAPIPEGSASSAPAASGSARAVVPNGKIQNRLAEQLGGAAEFERFSSQILDVDEEVRSHALALRNLAQQFPSALEQGLSAEDRRVLREMAREHVTSLSGTVDKLQHVLTPVLTSLGGAAAWRTASPETAWQGSTEGLVRASLRVQVLLSVLMGVSPGQSSSELPSAVLSAISDLRSDLDQCQQLLAQEGGG